MDGWRGGFVFLICTEKRCCWTQTLAQDTCLTCCITSFTVWVWFHPHKFFQNIVFSVSCVVMPCWHVFNPCRSLSHHWLKWMMSLQHMGVLDLVGWVKLKKTHIFEHRNGLTPIKHLGIKQERHPAGACGGCFNHGGCFDHRFISCCLVFFFQMSYLLQAEQYF